MIRTSSAQALHDLTESGKRDRNTIRIYEMVKSVPEGMTRREIEECTGLRTNQVTGRVREMLNQKKLAEGVMRKCSITGNFVNVVMVGD